MHISYFLIRFIFFNYFIILITCALQNVDNVNVLIEISRKTETTTITTPRNNIVVVSTTPLFIPPQSEITLSTPITNLVFTTSTMTLSTFATNFETKQHRFRPILKQNIINTEKEEKLNFILSAKLTTTFSFHSKTNDASTTTVIIIPVEEEHENKKKTTTTAILIETIIEQINMANQNETFQTLQNANTIPKI